MFSPEILEGRAEYSVKWALTNDTPTGSLDYILQINEAQLCQALEISSFLLDSAQVVFMETADSCPMSFML